MPHHPEHDRLMGATYYGEQPKNAGQTAIPWCYCPHCAARHELRWGPVCRQCGGTIDFGSVTVEGLVPHKVPATPSHALAGCGSCRGRGKVEVYAGSRRPEMLVCWCSRPTTRDIFERLAMSAIHWSQIVVLPDFDDEKREAILRSWKAFELEIWNELSGEGPLSLGLKLSTNGDIQMEYGNDYSRKIAEVMRSIQRAVALDPDKFMRASGFAGAQAYRSHLAELGDLLSEIVEEACPSTNGSSPSGGSDGGS